MAHGVTSWPWLHANGEARAIAKNLRGLSWLARRRLYPRLRPLVSLGKMCVPEPKWALWCQDVKQTLKEFKKLGYTAHPACCPAMFLKPSPKAWQDGEHWSMVAERLALMRKIVGRPARTIGMDMEPYQDFTPRYPAINSTEKYLVGAAMEPLLDVLRRLHIRPILLPTAGFTVTCDTILRARGIRRPLAACEMTFRLYDPAYTAAQREDAWLWYKRGLGYWAAVDSRQWMPALYTRPGYRAMRRVGGVLSEQLKADRVKQVLFFGDEERHDIREFGTIEWLRG